MGLRGRPGWGQIKASSDRQVGPLQADRVGPNETVIAGLRPWPVKSPVQDNCHSANCPNPSTVSRRFSVTAGFYRTCVIDGLLEHSPAEHVRRPSVPPESPTLGFTHLQFEALLTAARESPHPCDFALVAMLGLLGLRIFEATGADIADLGEEHGHRVLRVCGKGTKVVLVPLPPAVGRAIDRAVGTRTRGPILLNSRGARMDRHAATRRLRRLAETAAYRSPGHIRTCSATLSSRPCSTRA